MSTSPFDVNKPSTPPTWRDEVTAACFYGPIALAFVILASIFFLLKPPTSRKRHDKIRNR